MRKIVVGLLASVLLMFLFLTSLPVSAANVTNVALSVASGPPGTVVMITGSGFSSASYTVTMGGITVVPTTAVAADAISATFAVPVLPRTGMPYGVAVTTAGDNVNTPYFTITPAIWLSSASGSASDIVKANGYGFFANTTITVSFDGDDKVSTTSDSSGTFANIDLTIPQAKGGWHTIAARDYIGSSPGVVFVIATKISLSASSGQIGSTIICSGSGFAALSNVSFSLDAVTIGGTAITDANGTLGPTTLTIPAMPGGLHTFKAQDGSSNSAVSTVTVTSNMSISPASGAAGTVVSIIGSGFQENGNISITYNGVNITTAPSPVQSNTNGSFTASFNVPALPTGIYDIVASDSINSASTRFTSSAAATISPVNGTVGTKITASGSGFRPRASVNVNYDGVQAAAGPSDIYGNFSVTFSAPSSSQGLHHVVVTDKTNTLSFTFNIEPSIAVNPASGYVGSEITVDANGFSSNKTIVVKYDDNQLTSGQTSDYGAFNTVIKTPASKGGNHLVAISDGTSTLTAVFAMDSIPPAQPALFLPAPLTKADKNTTFSWQGISDPSDVSYMLQVATDNTFTSLVLQKQGLTASEYALTETDVLQPVSKKMPYHWRVKAIDGASNESDWSTPSTFYIGFVLADWTLYIVFAGIAILCGVIGFLIGMRLRHKPPASNPTLSE